MIFPPKNYLLYSTIFLVLLMLILLVLIYLYRDSDNGTNHNLAYGLTGVAIILVVNTLYNTPRVPT